MSMRPQRSHADSFGRAVSLQALNAVLGPQSSPLGTVAPLRRLDAPALGPLPRLGPALPRSIGSSGGLEPIKTVQTSHRVIPRSSSSSFFNLILSLNPSFFKVSCGSISWLGPWEQWNVWLSRRQTAGEDGSTDWV